MNSRTAGMPRLSTQVIAMTPEAQKVITPRVRSMSGLWKTAPDQNNRMVAGNIVAVIAPGGAVGRCFVNA